jgi:transposase
VEGSGEGPGIEGLRALHLARRSAVKAQTAAMNQIHAILVMAPEPLRTKYRNLSKRRLINALARSRAAAPDPVETETLTALRVLAQRHRDLKTQTELLTSRIDALVSAANPALRAATGIGPAGSGREGPRRRARTVEHA